MERQTQQRPEHLHARIIDLAFFGLLSSNQVWRGIPGAITERIAMQASKLSGDGAVHTRVVRRRDDNGGSNLRRRIGFTKNRSVKMSHLGQKGDIA